MQAMRQQGALARKPKAPTQANNWSYLDSTTKPVRALYTGKHKVSTVQSMTNALIQRLLTIGLPMLCWTLAWWSWPASPNFALGWLVAPVLITPAFLAIQFVALTAVNRADPTPHASLLEHSRAWLGEVRVCLLVFHWWQPFQRTAVADSLNADPGAKNQRGVVLLHGFFCNRGFWTHWLKRLQSEHRVFVALDLEPAFGSIDAYVAAIDRAVHQVQQATGLAPVLVAHSMGGLAARAWLVSNAAKGAAAIAVYRVITLGTPHDGTWTANFSHTANGAQMKKNSAWLSRLSENEQNSQDIQFTCFYSNCDNIVFPVSSAKLEGADNRMVRNRGHIAMAHDPEVIKACWVLMQ
jgi:triacylglycerol lipase